MTWKAFIIEIKVTIWDDSLRNPVLIVTQHEHGV